MDQNLRYVGEAFFFLGLAARIAKWIFRTVEEVKDDTRFPGAPAPIGVDQHTRMMAMINHSPADMALTAFEPGHHCRKCGAQMHADIVHGGLAPCRKCGWIGGTAPAS